MKFCIRCGRRQRRSDGAGAGKLRSEESEFTVKQNKIIEKQ
jgi:hypothetical protein